MNCFEHKEIQTRFVCLVVGVAVAVTVALGATGVSEAIGTATSWVNVVDGGATMDSLGAIGIGGGGCMTWKVGCSDSSDGRGSETFEGSDTSVEGGGGSNGWETSGSTTGAGKDSTCIVFEQYEYLK